MPLCPDLRRWEGDTENGHGRNLHTRLVRQDLIPALEKARRPFDAFLAQRADFMTARSSIWTTAAVMIPT